MGTGTDVAIQASDLTLVRDDLLVAADAIRLSRRTLAVIKGNLFWAFAYNVAAIPLAAARPAQPDARRGGHGAVLAVRRHQQPAPPLVPLTPSPLLPPTTPHVMTCFPTFRISTSTGHHVRSCRRSRLRDCRQVSTCGVSTGHRCGVAAAGSRRRSLLPRIADVSAAAGAAGACGLVSSTRSRFGSLGSRLVAGTSTRSAGVRVLRHHGDARGPPGPRRAHRSPLVPCR